MQVLSNHGVSEINVVLRAAIRAVASSIAKTNYDGARFNIEQLAIVYCDILRQGHLDQAGFHPEMIRPSQAAEIMENMLKSGGNRFAMMDKSYRKTKCSMEQVIIARLRQSEPICSVVPECPSADFIMTFSAFVRRVEGPALRDIHTTTFDMIFSLDLQGAARRVLAMISGGAKYRREAYQAAAPRIARLALKSVPDFISGEGYCLERLDTRTRGILRRMLDAGLSEGAIEDVDLAEEQLARLKTPVAVPQYA